MRQMKDSGIEWIGEIPQEWEVTRIKYFFTCLDGKRIPIDSSQRVSGQYPYWGAGSITDYVNDYIFDEELVLLGEDGAPFFDKSRPVAFLVKEKIWVNNHIHVLKPLNKINSAYFVFYLNSVDYKTYINGSILNKLTQSNMNAIAFVCPPLPEQQRIADYLDAKCSKIDDTIEKQKAVIEKLKEYKQSVITEAVTKGLNPDAPMKDSGIEWIGDIPQGWLLNKFKYLSLAIGDGIHTTPQYDTEGSIFFVNGNNIGDETLVFKDGTNTINDEEYSNYKLPFLTENTVLITLNGATYGKTSFYNGEKILLGKSAGYITLKNNENKKYIRYFLQSNLAKSNMEVSLCGSTIANLSLRTLNDFIFPYPSHSEQQSIAIYLDKKTTQIDKAIEQKQKLIEKLTEYKKSLIYEAVTGKIEV